MCPRCTVVILVANGAAVRHAQVAGVRVTAGGEANALSQAFSITYTRTPPCSTKVRHTYTHSLQLTGTGTGRGVYNGFYHEKRILTCTMYFVLQFPSGGNGGGGAADGAARSSLPSASAL